MLLDDQGHLKLADFGTCMRMDKVWLYCNIALLDMEYDDDDCYCYFETALWISVISIVSLSHTLAADNLSHEIPKVHSQWKDGLCHMLITDLLWNSKV